MLPWPWIHWTRRLVLPTTAASVPDWSWKLDPPPQIPVAGHKGLYESISKRNGILLLTPGILFFKGGRLSKFYILFREISDAKDKFKRMKNTFPLFPNKFQELQQKLMTWNSKMQGEQNDLFVFLGDVCLCCGNSIYSKGKCMLGRYIENIFFFTGNSMLAWKLVAKETCLGGKRF